MYSRFEDVPVWQESRKFVNKVYNVLVRNDKLRRDFSLVDQLKRAAYSILLNIAEGFERSSNKEFANFLNIAKGSAGEVRSILYILLDNNYISKEDFNILNTEILTISAHLSNFRKFLLSKSDYKK
ncbi:MAG TPA: four helix bundle protein [Candidatus Magasanikbacteria bacterium]|nr:four helix bundle protein [Candidatus Magasanikbacteria bacterium]